MFARHTIRQRVPFFLLVTSLGLIGGCGAEEELKPDEGVSPFFTGKQEDAPEGLNPVRPVTKVAGNDITAAANLANGVRDTKKAPTPPPIGLPEQFSFEDLDKLNKAANMVAEKGNYVEAAKAFDQVLGADPQNRVALYGRAAVASELLTNLSEQDRVLEIGRAADLMRTLKRLYKTLSPKEAKAFGVSLYNEAAVVGQEGQTAKSLEILKEAVDEGFNNWYMAETGPAFNSARSDPAFQALIVRMKDIALKNARAHMQQRLEQNVDFPFSFRLKDINGKVVTSDELKGKVAVVDFWGTWCGPCRMAIPSLIALHHKYAKQGLVVVGIACEKVSPEAAVPLVKQYIEEVQMPYTCLLGDEAIIAQIPNFSGFPTSLVIDAKGKMRLGSLGAQPGEAEAIEDAVILLLEERKAQQAQAPAAKKP